MKRLPSLVLIMMIFLAPLASQEDTVRSLNLEESVSLASVRNSRVISDSLDRQDSWRRLRLQMREFFPDLEVGYSRTDSVTLESPDSHLNKINLSVSQMLFNGGKDVAAYRSARRDLQLKDLYARDLMDTIEFQVTVQYVEVLKNRQILIIQERSREILLEQVAIADLEYRLGELRQIDFLDIKLNAREFELGMQDTEEKLLQSRHSLANLLYFPLEQLPELEGSLNIAYQGLFPDRSVDDEELLRTLREKAEAYNNDLLALQLQEMNTERALQDSRLSWMPKVEAVADFSVSGTEFPLQEPSFSIGLDFTFAAPVLPSSVSLRGGKANPDEHNRSFSAESQVMDNLGGLMDPHTARKELYKKQLEKEELRRSLSFQVRSLVETIGRTSRRIGIQKEKLAIMEDKLRIEEQKMNIGEITRLEYVESEIAFSQQKTALLDSIVQLFSTERELIKTCGLQGRGNADTLILYQEETDG